jgi:hypothetical protein
LSLPSYDEFRQALTDPSRRAQIGLVIADSDAQALAGNEEWARNYFDSWIAMAAPAPTAVMPEAPSAPSPFSSAPTEPFSSAPSAPPAAPDQPAGYAPAGYQAAPQQGNATAPQQGQPFGGQPGYQNMPQGQMPTKKGLPGWALAVIIGGAALVLLGGIGVTAFVLSTVDNDDRDTASSSQSDDETPAPEESDEPVPEDEPSGDPFGDIGEDLDYSEADKASYLAAVTPIYGLEASEYMDQEFIDDTLITGGEAVCASLEYGAGEAELIESYVSAGLTEDDANALIDASKTYLCN